MKISKIGATGKKNTVVAPEYDKLKNKYELAFSMDSKHLIDMYAIVQKFTGQAISADLYISYTGGERKVSHKKLLQDYLYMTKMGMKTRYYVNSEAGVDFSKDSVTLEVTEGDDCEACKL